jgi:hypothetical protein
MAWIESHQDLAQHPKVFTLQTALNADLPTAIGVLHLLWHFTLKFCWRDGDLSKYTADQIAHAVGWKGASADVLEALQESGWLDGMVVHDWMDYAGKIVRDRIYNNKRRNTPSNVVDARKTTATLPDLTLPNHTKETITPPPPGAFEIIWEKYPRKLGKDEAARHFKSQVKTFHDWADIQCALDRFKTKLQKDATEEKFIPHGSTWFNKRWRDWINYTEQNHGTHVSPSVSGMSDIFKRAREVKRTSDLRKATELPGGTILDGFRDKSVDKAERTDVGSK